MGKLVLLYLQILLFVTVFFKNKKKKKNQNIFYPAKHPIL